MNHPDLDLLTADAADLASADERERLQEHLDACPACLELYSRVCAERAVLEAARPGGDSVRPLALAGVVAVLAVGALWLISGDSWTQGRNPNDSILLLASPASRAQAAAELLRMGPSAISALERGAREDDATISRACQDLLHMIATQDPADTRSLVAAVEDAWKSIEGAVADENVWADKKDFQTAFEEWKKSQRPDAAALEAAEKAILAWYEASAKPAGLEWRVRKLLSVSARDRKDARAAAAHLDQAIAAYPDKRYPNPAKHSKFQHLVNDRAMMTWEEKGFDAAIAYAADLLSKDGRFHYFHSWPWDARFDEQKKPELRTVLVERIRAAYTERSKKFPDQAGACRRHSRELDER